MSKMGLATVVAVLALAGFVSSLGHGFVWDDPVILTRQLPVFRATSVWLPPANVPQFASDYYRPLVIASYIFDQSVGRGAPWAFHLTMVIAHALASVAVFLLGHALLLRCRGIGEATATWAAAIGAALFAVHPVHVEGVAWMAGRADVFACLFGVLAVYAHLASRRSRAFVFVTPVALLLALLSKEVAVSLLVVLVFLDLLVPEPAAANAPGSRAQRRAAATPEALPPSAWMRYAPIAAVLLLYVALRFAAGSDLARTTGSPVGFVPGRLLLALGVYFEKMLVPLWLNAYITDLPEGAMALLASLTALSIYVYLLARAWRAGYAPVVFLLLWFLVTLAPSLSIVIKIPEVPVAERYLYLPSVGFCLAIGSALALLIEKRAALRTPVMAASAVVVLLFLAGTMRRSQVWASDAALWQDTSAKSPSAAMPLQSFGDTLVRANRLDEAEQVYHEALRRNGSAHDRAATYSNLGMVALTRGSMEQAEEYYRQALAERVTAEALYSAGAIGLRRADAASAAGDVETMRERAEQAVENLSRAERMSPLDANLQFALAYGMSLVGRQREAGAHYEKALALGLSPDLAQRARQALGRP